MTAAVSLRSNLLTELDEARRDLLSAIEGLNEAQLSGPLPGGEWSAKDVLAHVSSWDELRCFEIARADRDETPVYALLREDDFAPWNAVLMSVRRDLPLSQVLRELSYARERVLEMIASVPDDRLAEAAPGRVRIRRAADHDREHTAHIRDWRTREGL